MTHPNSTLTTAKRAGLRDIPCLDGLDATALNRLRKEVSEKEYRRGHIVFRQGDICEEILLLTQGSVKLFRVSNDGRQQTLRVTEAGDCFCVAPTFPGGRYYTAAQCLTEVRLLRLGPDACRALRRDHPGWAARVIGCLCQRLAETAARLETASTRQVRRRLVGYLVDLARTQGVLTGNRIVLSGLTHDELAACVGTAREVI